MGDYFERIVDLDVGADDAAATAMRMADWLVSRGLLSRELTGDGVYSLNAEEGFRPGPHWARITQEWGADWQPGPVAVIVGRHEHHGGQGAIEPESADCPACGAATVIIDYPQRWTADPAVWRPFGAAIEQWKQTGTGIADCAHCQVGSPITEWRWPSGFALGALAFDFWGWPPLTDDFVTEFTARLGHRVAHHTGKF